jgi:hypothetical protein
MCWLSFTASELPCTLRSDTLAVDDFNEATDPSLDSPRGEFIIISAAISSLLTLWEWLSVSVWH